jgi:hypothetical protein
VLVHVAYRVVTVASGIAQAFGCSHPASRRRLSRRSLMPSRAVLGEVIGGVLMARALTAGGET